MANDFTSYNPFLVLKNLLGDIRCLVVTLPSQLYGEFIQIPLVHVHNSENLYGSRFSCGFSHMIFFKTNF